MVILGGPVPPIRTPFSPNLVFIVASQVCSGTQSQHHSNRETGTAMYLLDNDHTHKKLYRIRRVKNFRQTTKNGLSSSFTYCPSIIWHWRNERLAISTLFWWEFCIDIVYVLYMLWPWHCRLTSLLPSQCEQIYHCLDSSLLSHFPISTGAGSLCLG